MPVWLPAKEVRIIASRGVFIGLELGDTVTFGLDVAALMYCWGRFEASGL